MKITVGVSNRHVHLKKEDFNVLFENDMEMDFALKQPHNFASKYFVNIKTDKDVIKRVRVLGGIRNYTQVEISKTDAYKLGINPPIRTSGDVEGSEEVTIIGSKGSVTLNCCIIPNRHIHITEEDKKKYGLKDTLKVKIGGVKGGIIDNVYLKISEEAYFELHLDTDDANAFWLKTNDEVEIINE